MCVYLSTRTNIIFFSSPVYTEIQKKITFLNRQNIQHIDQFAVNRLVNSDGFIEWNIYYLVILHTYHDIALTVLQCLDCSHSQTAGKDTVLGSRHTTTLKMAEYSHTCLELWIFMHKTVRIILGSACTVLLAL